MSVPSHMQPSYSQTVSGIKMKNDRSLHHSTYVNIHNTINTAIEVQEQVTRCMLQISSLWRKCCNKQGLSPSSEVNHICLVNKFLYACTEERGEVKSNELLM